MSKTLEIAVCQMTSGEDVAANQRAMLAQLASIADLGRVDLVCFPEYCLHFQVSDAPPPPLTLQSDVFAPLVEVARAANTTLHLGSVPLTDAAGVCVNSTVILAPDGARSTPYQKIHLFDAHPEAAGAYRESDTFRHGDRTSVIDFQGWPVAHSICFDLRFTELYARYRAQGVQLVLVPSAFTAVTGEAHWTTLLRARAIEMQAYVVAAAQAGHHGGAKRTFGHSLVIDPWGTIIAEADVAGAPRGMTGAGAVLRARIDPERVAEVRKRIPMPLRQFS